MIEGGYVDIVGPFWQTGKLNLNEKAILPDNL